MVNTTKGRISASPAAPRRVLCRWLLTFWGVIVGAALSLMPAPGATTRAATAITGAGSTFVAPVMLGQWIPGYTADHPEATVAFAPVGSTSGVKQWTQGGADFAASDAILSAADEQAARTRCGGALKIPVTISAVALIYNVPGLKGELRLSASLVARIFLGQVTNWHDPAIAALNPERRLPDLAIQPIHRSGGSGTTFILTHYLTAVSAEWQRGPGAGASINWPTGAGVKGSAGIVVAVSTTLGGIGYVDLAYAVQNNIDYAVVQNARGAFVAPGVNAASVAAASYAAAMPHDLQQVIVNAADPRAYPITGYSYIFLCSRQIGQKGQTLVDFVRYAVTTGQRSTALLYYAPLPASVQRLDEVALKAVAQP